MEATDLNDLLASAPSQSNLPQGTTFAPMVTGGVDPFIAPVNTSPQQPSHSAVSSHMFSTVKYAAKSFMTYFGLFLGAILISLSTPRSMILQYIPNTYTSAGVPSYTGAAILGGVAVAVAYVIGALGSSLF